MSPCKAVFVVVIAASSWTLAYPTRLPALKSKNEEDTSSSTTATSTHTSTHYRDFVSPSPPSHSHLVSPVSASSSRPRPSLQRRKGVNAERLMTEVLPRLILWVDQALDHTLKSKEMQEEELLSYNVKIPNGIFDLKTRLRGYINNYSKNMDPQVQYFIAQVRKQNNRLPLMFGEKLPLEESKKRYIESSARHYTRHKARQMGINIKPAGIGIGRARGYRNDEPGVAENREKQRSHYQARKNGLGSRGRNGGNYSGVKRTSIDRTPKAANVDKMCWNGAGSEQQTASVTSSSETNTEHASASEGDTRGGFARGQKRRRMYEPLPPWGSRRQRS